MASVNTLPIELLYKIVDLTVEDTIALRVNEYDSEQERLRRGILVRLALVSKDFTRPAQLALWRYINIDNIEQVGELIEAGFGSDKVVEELDIHIYLKALGGYERFNKLVHFLRGVKQVINITQFVIDGPMVPFDKLFEIDSIQELKSIEFYDYNSRGISVSFQTRLPSHLRRLTINRFTERADLNMISRLIESSVSTLTSIKLSRIRSSQYSGSTLISVVASLGPKLQKLDITDCDDSILSSLVPCCTSLKSLSIHSYDPDDLSNFKFVVDTLRTIPKSVILESFSILLPPTSDLVYFPSFIQLLHTSPFSQLKRLNLALIGFYGNAPPQELVDFVRENDDLMELLENRGTILEFGTEEEVRIDAEKEKQRIYQERQEELDSDQKNKKKKKEKKK